MKNILQGMDVCAKCDGELEDGGCINLDCENWRFGKQWDEFMARGEPKVRHSPRMNLNPEPLKVVPQAQRDAWTKPQQVTSFNTYEVVVREVVEQTFTVKAPTAADAQEVIEGLGFGHDGCVDWTGFLLTENDDVTFSGEEKVQRTVRRPKVVE